MVSYSIFSVTDTLNDAHTQSFRNHLLSALALSMRKWATSRLLPPETCLLVILPTQNCGASLGGKTTRSCTQTARRRTRAPLVSNSSLSVVIVMLILVFNQESIIIKHPAVAKALMFGREQFHSGIIIQPVEDMKDEASRDAFIDDIW